MNLQQLILNYAQQLHYLTLNQIQQIQQTKTPIQQHLSPNQLQNLKLLLFKHYLVTYAYQSKLLTQEQCQHLLNKKIQEIKSGNTQFILQSLEQNLIPQSFLQKVLDNLHKQNIITHQDFQSLTTTILKLPKVEPIEAPVPSPSQVFEEAVDELGQLFVEDSPKNFGRYKIIEELGRGGMGKVYKAYDPQLKREIAIKTILRENQEQLIKRFTKEAEAMARLSHPNIVRVYDMGQVDKTYYFTMDFVSGKNLSQLIQEERITTRRAVEITRKIALAIDYAHKQGIIHRDIKPANIMLTDNGEPLVMDFGLVREVEGDEKLSKSGAVIGTPAYMPPEQALGKRKEIDERSDVYSIGVVLYEMLTGNNPFRGPNTHVILQQVIEREPQSPSKISKIVPKDVSNICLKAMAKAKKDRYQSGYEMTQDLDRFLRGQAVQATSVKLRYKMTKWLMQNKLLTTFILFLVFSAVVFIYSFFFAPGKITVIAKIKVAEKLQETTAKITVDNKVITASSLSRYSLSPGFHKIKMEVEKHKNLDFAVEINPGEERKLEKTFAHNEGYVTINSPISQVEAIFTNKETKQQYKLVIPTYRYTINTGNYEVTFRKKNYFAKDIDITIVHNQQHQLNVALTPMLLWQLQASNRSNLRSIAVADLDRNGELELLYSKATGTLTAFDLYKRKQLWTQKKILSASYSKIGLRDINRDGTPEIINSHHDRFMILDGKTRKELFHQSNWWGRTYVIYDANSDGYDDIILFTYFHLKCFDLKTGKLIWQQPRDQRGSNGSQPVIEYPYMLYAEMGQLFRIDMRSGERTKIFSWPGGSTPWHIVKSQINGCSVLFWYCPKKGLFCLNLDPLREVWNWQPLYFSHSKETLVKDINSKGLLVKDINNDGMLEIVLHLDKIYCLDAKTGKKLWDFASGNQNLGHMPIVADLDRDKQLEIICNTSNGKIFTLDNKGKLIADFVAPGTIEQTIVIDTNNDRKPEIVFLAGKHIYCIQPILDLQLRILNESKTRIYGEPKCVDINNDNQIDIVGGDPSGNFYCLNGKSWELLWHKKLQSYIVNPVGVTDLENDGLLEVVVATHDNIYLFDHQGREVWHKKLKRTGLKAPQIANVDNVGTDEIIVTCYQGGVFCLSAKNGEVIWFNDDLKGTTCPPTVGDVDGDGVLEVIVSSHVSLRKVYPVYCINAKTGHTKWQAQVPYHEESGGISLFDIDNDNIPEMFVRQIAGSLSCLKGNGKVLWNRCFYGGDFKSNMHFMDVDGDQKIDLIIGNRDGYLFCIDPVSGSVKWQKDTCQENFDRTVSNQVILDINDDEQQEIVSTNYNHGLYICSGRDGGWLGHVDTIPTFENPLLKLDIDRDGELDLLFTNDNREIVCIYKMKDYLKRHLQAISPHQNSNQVYIARCNQLLHNRAYRQLDMEVPQYLEKMKEQKYLADFYLGISAFAKRNYRDSLLRLIRCEKAAQIFDARFLIAWCYLEDGKKPKAQEITAELLKKSVIKYSECYRQYLHLLSKNSQRKLKKILPVAVKNSKCEKKIVNLYQAAMLMENNLQMQKLLPILLRYASPKSKGYQKKYHTYVQQIQYKISQYNTSIYTRHRTISELTKALEFIPQSYELLAQRGQKYIETNLSVELGLRDISKSLAIKPKQPDLVLFYAKMSYQLGNYQQALTYFKKLEKLDPKNTEAILSAVLVYLKVKENDKALTQLEKFNKKFFLPTNHPLSVVYKSLVSLANGNIRQSYRDIQQVDSRYLQTWLPRSVLRFLEQNK